MPILDPPPLPTPDDGHAHDWRRDVTDSARVIEGERSVPVRCAICNHRGWGRETPMASPAVDWPVFRGQVMT